MCNSKKGMKHDMEAFHNHPGFIRLCQEMENSAPIFNEHTLLQCLHTCAVFHVKVDDKVIHAINNHLKVKLTQMTVKQVRYFEELLVDLKLNLLHTISHKEMVSCELKVQKLLETDDVRLLIDGLKYARFMKLSTTLQQKIVDRLLNLQDNWTKEDSLEMIRLLKRIQYLEHGNFTPLFNAVTGKCTKLASYYHPKQLVFILRNMREMSMYSQCVQFCKTVAGRAVRERWSYNLLQAVSSAFSMIGFIDEEYLEFFSVQLLRERKLEDFKCFAKLSYKPRNFDALVETLIASTQLPKVSNLMKLSFCHIFSTAFLLFHSFMLLKF